MFFNKIWPQNVGKLWTDEKKQTIGLPFSASKMRCGFSVATDINLLSELYILFSWKGNLNHNCSFIGYAFFFFFIKNGNFLCLRLSVNIAGVPTEPPTSMHSNAY